MSQVLKKEALRLQVRFRGSAVLFEAERLSRGLYRVEQGGEREDLIRCVKGGTRLYALSSLMEVAEVVQELPEVPSSYHIGGCY